MVVVPARILPTPTIQYSKKTTEVEKGKGQWNLRAQRFYKGCEIKHLLVLSFTQCGDRAYTPNNTARLISQFRETCEDVGIMHNKSDASACREEKIDVNGAGTEVEPLFRKYSTSKPTLMLIILPDEIKDLFQRVKYPGDLKASRPSSPCSAKQLGALTVKVTSSTGRMFSLRSTRDLEGLTMSCPKRT